MIIVKESENKNFEKKIILLPNQSLDWEGNKRVIWLLGFVCMGIAVAFTVIAGAWVMLPFAGLEILSLSLALYYVSWKLSYRHILTINENELIIEKGVYRPRGKWIWKKNQTVLKTYPSKQDWAPPKLELNNDINKEKIYIGDFLNLDDAQNFIEVLETEILVLKELKPFQ